MSAFFTGIVISPLGRLQMSLIYVKNKLAATLTRRDR